MQAPRLIFHPQQDNIIADPEALRVALTAIGFLGPRRDTDEENSFYVGEHFLDLLTFLGCSPNINLSPDEGERYCYVDLTTFETPEFIVGSQPFQPRCRSCRQAIPDWREQLTAQSSMATAQIRCQNCNRVMGLSEVNWKHSAGFGRQMISVHQIYLHEAVPGEKLLQTLSSVTPGCEWSYFYAL